MTFWEFIGPASEKLFWRKKAAQPCAAFFCFLGANRKKSPNPPHKRADNRLLMRRPE
jgi:hypothetical protein